MKNIIEATQNYGSCEVYTKGNIITPPTTVAGMRADVLKRAKQTLRAVKAYEGGKLEAPMARSGQNAIVVKIGYGDRNEKLFEYADGKPERRVNGDTVQERRKEAVSFLTASIKSIKSGGLDEFLETKLASYRARSKLGKKARKAAKAKRLGVVDIQSSKAA